MRKKRGERMERKARKARKVLQPPGIYPHLLQALKKTLMMTV
jgi:hypothetical protein